MTREELFDELKEEFEDKFGEENGEYFISLFNEIYDQAEVNCSGDEEEEDGEEDFDLPEDDLDKEFGGDDEELEDFEAIAGEEDEV
jgi:hypothetical protein